MIAEFVFFGGFSRASRAKSRLHRRGDTMTMTMAFFVPIWLDEGITHE
ncbi:hypothetical protein RMSM_00156 [Rhodopirellula maiorica SM1]|uniref:Uncharacterized protein n=1 Tax=Rhodopirellula maiorica SM1 TaxID=1265738 RepID=M5S9R4_9BACT|nr:hypothetical protein RMSM_00156 [Rhodopirellula maiorica SM1]